MIVKNTNLHLLSLFDSGKYTANGILLLKGDWNEKYTLPLNTASTLIYSRVGSAMRKSNYWQNRFPKTTLKTKLKCKIPNNEIQWIILLVKFMHKLKVIYPGKSNKVVYLKKRKPDDLWGPN
jgi:hypothetical protein